MIKILAIMAGGGIGASFRHGIFLIVQRFAGPVFPAGTLAANMIGSLAIGFLWSFFEESHLSNEWRLFIFTGLLGGFTTFSTFTRETTQLIKVGEWKIALIYLLISNIVGIGMVFLGYGLSKKILLGLTTG